MQYLRVLKQEKAIFFSILSFYEHMKFYAQLS